MLRSSYELLAQHPPPSHVHLRATGVLWSLRALLDDVDAHMAQMRRCCNPYSYGLWLERYRSYWGTGPGTKDWFVANFGRSPLSGELEELRGTCADHPIPSSAQIMELLGVCAVDWAHTRRPVLDTLTNCFHLNNLLPILAFYLVETRTRAVSREEAEKMLDKITATVPPITMGNRQDTVHDAPQAYRTWYADTLRSLMNDYADRTGFWREGPPPLKFQAPVDPRSKVTPAHPLGPVSELDWWTPALNSGWRPNLNAGPVAYAERVVTSETVRVPTQLDLPRPRTPPASNTMVVTVPVPPRGASPVDQNSRASSDERRMLSP